MAQTQTEQMSFKEFVQEIWRVCWNAPSKLKRGLLLCFIGISATAAFDGFLPIISGYLTNTLKDAISLHVLTGILVFWTLFLLYSESSKIFLNK